MKGITPLMRVFCIFSIVLAKKATYMIQEPTTHADSNDQTHVRTDQLAMLTKRLSELEQSRTKDAELRENDARALTKLNDEVEEQKRLRVEELHRITVLTARVDKLERQCEYGEHSENYISMETQNPPQNETTYYNGSDVSSPFPASSTLDDMTNEEDLSRHSSGISKSKIIRRQGRIQSRQPGRITRVNPADDTVAFHAILTHTLVDPSTNQAVVFDTIITNSGGVSYSRNSGVFTSTQSGVHVFSWSIGVPHDQYIHTELVRNNVVIGYIVTGEGDSYESATSATAAVHLEVGDEVWVRVNGHGSGSDIKPFKTMFTGFRLQ